MNTNQKDAAISKALNDVSAALAGVKGLLEGRVDDAGEFGDALQLLSGIVEQQACIVSAAAAELGKRARQPQAA